MWLVVHCDYHALSFVDIKSIKRYCFFHFCQISAWCPVENDEKLSSKTPLLKNTEKFTVYIKNSVAFPYFGSDYRKNNILSEYEEIIMSLQTIVLTIQIYLSIFHFHSISIGGLSSPQSRALDCLYSSGLVNKNLS